jgi:hypothetical protein
MFQPLICLAQRTRLDPAVVFAAFDFAASSPARSRAMTCLEIAFSETWKGLAISLMVAGRRVSRRRIARRVGSASAEKTRSSATAYWTSRCLHVVAELGVADHLGDQPQSTESLAKATGTSAGPLYRVLRLLASVGVFEWKDGTWHHTEASRFLRSDGPGFLRDYVRMLGLPVFWNAFEDLEHSLRTANPPSHRDTPAAFSRTSPRTRKRAASSMRR